MTVAVPPMFARLRRDEHGGVAIIFGLMFVTLTFIAGMGLDFARIVDARTRISAAADAAALAAGRALVAGKLTDAEIRTMANDIFDANLATRGTKAAKINTFNITVDRNTGKVNVGVDAEVAMTMTAIAGFTKVKLPVSNAAIFQTKDIEVGMALDITGSMGSIPSGGGKRKIDALKDAFEAFADTLLPDQPVAGQQVRIGLAPYSAAINLGAYAGPASGFRSNDNCIVERMGSDKETDAAAAAGNYFKVKADGIKDIDPTEGSGGNSYTCPTPTLTPLSDDRTSLVNTVKSYQPNGWTAGHIGVQWGWNLVSENYAGFWGGTSQPEAYSKIADGKLVKAVVLMTDGIFNTSYHNGKSADQAIKMCDNMKAKGVLVFSIAFDAPADAQKTLKACATSGNSYYADATNDEELRAAFAKFASKLVELHLSN